MTAPALLELTELAVRADVPADRLRPPVQSFQGAVHPFVIPADLATGLRGLARSESSTLFMTVLSAFFALLFFAVGANVLDNLNFGRATRMLTRLATFAGVICSSGE